MSKERRHGAFVTNILLAVINVLLSLCAWQGYQFINEVRSAITAHEHRIDGHDTAIAELKAFASFSSRAGERERMP